MNRLLLTALLLLASPAWAAPIDDAKAAHARGDYAAALGITRPLAVEGDARAQSMLGWMYEKGQGVVQDYVEAIKWYRLAAAQGNAWAQYNLGLMYYEVVQDYVEAVKWYRLAAAQGDAKAQNNLGLMYDEGKGVVQDYVEAVKWWKLAAAQGYAVAKSNLEKLAAAQKKEKEREDPALEMKKKQSAYAEYKKKVNATAASAEWTRAHSNDDLILYEDRATIRRNGNFVKMWVLLDFKTVRTVAGYAGYSYLSEKAQWEFDCKEEKRRTLAFTWFAGQMGNGKVVHSDGKDGGFQEPSRRVWIPIEPGRIAETLWKIACGKR